MTRVTAARILMVEDSDAIRLPVATALTAHGFAVEATPNGADLERRLGAFRPDLVILDVMLPGRDGFTLLPVVRRASTAAVLMLTARDALADRLHGLTAGADDYLVKPFAMAELVARDLTLDAVLCNRLEVDAAGVYTGRPLGEVCFGDGKRSYAQAYASQAGVPLSACAFYTDSYSDLPVMEVVGRPVAVHPDRRLRREALRRGWPVVDWGSPAAARTVVLDFPSQ